MSWIRANEGYVESNLLSTEKGSEGFYSEGGDEKTVLVVVKHDFDPL